MRLAVDITKRLGSFCLHVAFACEDGVLGILGASGCGKSMTLKCIAGIERPDSGHIELDGVTLFDSEKRINLPPQKRHVGYLFQNYALFPNMTVRQNILCGLRAEKRSRAQSEQALHEVMELLGLSKTAAYGRLHRLTEQGRLVRIGGKYYLPGDVVPPEQHLETIRAYLSRAGFAYRQDIADLLHIQRKQCALILRHMVEQGELVQSGQKYYLPQSGDRKAE